MRRVRFLILFAVFIMVSSILTFVAMHFKTNDDVSLSLFELPTDLPYLYCEFNGHPEITGTDARTVLFVFWRNGKMHRITGRAAAGEWDFAASTPDALQVLDRANQLDARKARIIPPPGERDVEGRILASDAGLISKITHAPNIPVILKAELSKFSDNEYIMNFDAPDIGSVISAAWRKDLSPIKIKNFPFIKGETYARLALNITLIELIPQFQLFISQNINDKKMISSLRSMRGEMHATVGSGSALWDGISVPALLMRFNLKNDAGKQALFDFIYGLFNKKYELSASNSGYYSYAPTSLLLSRSKDFLAAGIIDRRSATRTKNSAELSALPKPPEEALLWLSFSPRCFAEAVSNFMLQINPDLNFEAALGRLNKIENCTLTLDTISSGVVRWTIGNE